MYKNCMLFNVYMLLIHFISTSEFTWLKTCVSYRSREIPTCFSVRKPIGIRLYKVGTFVSFINYYLNFSAIIPVFKAYGIRFIEKFS